jgi:hypothetical protein
MELPHEKKATSEYVCADALILSGLIMVQLVGFCVSVREPITMFAIL